MKLDDYAEFNDEKPDEDLDEPGGKNGGSSTAARIIMAVLVVGVLAIIGAAARVSFKDGSDLADDTASVPVPSVIWESKDTSAKESGEGALKSEPSSGAEESSESGSDEIETEFMPDHSRVTAKEVVNLRSMPSTENENCVILGTLSKGEVLNRTGINYELGWSKLEYNGQVVYAVTSYLEVVE